MSEWLVPVIAALPLFVVWVSALVEVARRPDLTRGRRIAWFLLLLLTSVGTLAVYVLVRPPRGRRRFSTGDEDRGGAAAELVLVAERQRRGQLTAAEYRSAVERLTGRTVTTT